MDSDDDFGPDFFSAVDQLVAQHKSGVSRGLSAPAVSCSKALAYC